MKMIEEKKSKQTTEYKANIQTTLDKENLQRGQFHSQVCARGPYRSRKKNDVCDTETIHVDPVKSLTVTRKISMQIQRNVDCDTEIIHVDPVKR